MLLRRWRWATRLPARNPGFMGTWRGETRHSRGSARPWAPGQTQPDAVSADEDVFREERGYQHVRGVHHLADLQVHRHAADGVGLLPRPAAFSQMVDLVQQRVAGGEGQVLGVVNPVPGNGDAGGGEETARGGELRRQVVVLPGEPEVTDVPGRRLALAQAE